MNREKRKQEMTPRGIGVKAGAEIAAERGEKQEAQDGRMRGMKMIALVLALSCAKGAGQNPPAGVNQWVVKASGIKTNLRGVSATPQLGARGEPPVVVWASGSNGVILESVDSGETWKQLHVEGGEALDFRGIQAFDTKTAYVMSSGEGEKSRIYKTTDGGASWELQYTDKRAEFFLDALVCSSANACYALSDPVDGKFLLVSTTDGKHWSELPRDNMPPARVGEGAFAASNSSLALFGKSEIYFGTGGTGSARVFHSADRGLTWSVVDTPIASPTASSGIFSLVRTGNAMVAVGGDYKATMVRAGVAAFSRDAGHTWRLAEQQPSGYRSAVAQASAGALVAAGPTGEDISSDGGANWSRFDAMNLNAVAFLENGMGWGVGPDGTIRRFAVVNPDFAVHIGSVSAATEEMRGSEPMIEFVARQWRESKIRTGKSALLRRAGLC
jgi:photosystem II stability/assembly factor-like uncharacterized protein